MLEVLREPMFLLLAASGTIYLLLGEKTDAAMLLGFVFITIGITVFQERKTERALEALRDLSSPRAMTVRDGVRKRIPGREVVRGDVVVVSGRRPRARRRQAPHGHEPLGRRIHAHRGVRARTQARLG